MFQIKRKPLSTALAQALGAVAVGAFISGVAYAQGADGNIQGTAKAGTTVTLTAPGGRTTTATAGSNGAFNFSKLPPGTYRVSTSDGVTREVIVAAGVDSRVSLETQAQASEKITVTGSRIQRDTFNSASPVQIITRDETLMSGFDSTTAALQGTGVTAGGGQINNLFGGFVTDGGPGANTLGLRGLGATRTLVLLNGRRIAPAGTRGAVGTADLNVLPTSVIDRIEILKDGASSIYGSDAVAGVVNIITRKNIKGVTFEGQANVPEESGGESGRASVTAGWTGDKGYVSGSFEIYNRRELTIGDRAELRCDTDYRRRFVGGVDQGWGSADFIDPLTGQSKCNGITSTSGNSGVTINTLGTGTLAGVGAAGSVGTSFNRWRPNSAITTGLPGFEGVGGGANNVNVRDTFDPRMYDRSLISPARLTTAFIQGGYDIGILGNAELYGEALLHKRESHQTGYRQLSLDYGRGNPLIPESMRNIPNLQAAPDLTTNGLPLQLRAFIGWGNDRGEQEVDYTKVLGGLKGNLPFRDWTYDAVAMFSKSDATYMFQSFITSRLAQSLDAVAGPNNTFTCRNPADGCVAAPVLSGAVIGGNLPQAWKDFIWKDVVGNTKYEESVATLNTTGTLFQMPYGPVRAAFGAEYRRAEIDDTPAIESQNSDLFNLTSSAITRGSDSVWELYGELELPILRGLKGAEELTVNVSGRYTDYKSYGSDTTYKVGALYSPAKWLSFRASQGTSYRAPALFEQFQGSTSGFLASTGDPCNNYGVNPNPIRRANCASEGLPTDFNATQSIRVNSVGGAAAGLKAETSKNTTLGLILQPQLGTGWGDISFAVDYFDIQIDNGVNQAGGGNLLILCYDDPQFRAGGSFCRLSSRAAAGTNRALTVDNSHINLSKDVTKGYDFTLRYVRNIGPGQFRFNGLITKFDEQAQALFQDDPLDSFNGSIAHGAPKMTGVGDFQYTWKEWRFRYGLEWIDKMESYTWFEQDPATSAFQMAVPSYTTHNFSVQYTADKWSVTAGVRNFLNEDLPVVSSGFMSRRGNVPIYSGYDFLGRTYFVNVQFTL